MSFHSKNCCWCLCCTLFIFPKISTGACCARSFIFSKIAAGACWARLFLPRQFVRNTHTHTHRHTHIPHTTQDHTMTLYAWAVLRAASVTADASGNDYGALDALASALFRSLSWLNPHPGSACPEQLCQLFQAHQVGLGACLLYVCVRVCMDVCMCVSREGG